MVAESNEVAGKSADAAGQADRLLTFFLELEQNIDGALLGIALDLRILGFDFIEIVQLVETKNAEFPGAIIKDIAFAEQQFAANDLIPGSCIAGEIDAANKVLFLLVEVEREVDCLCVVVRHQEAALR